MIEFFVVAAFLSVFWFAIWSMIAMSPVFTVSVLSVFFYGVYLIDQEMRRG